MQCPKCKADLPEPERRDPAEHDKPSDVESRPGEVTPEDALRVESPPAPCPQCGWSTMWNE